MVTVTCTIWLTATFTAVMDAELSLTAVSVPAVVLQVEGLTVVCEETPV
jgi:hypothetical protein